MTRRHLRALSIGLCLATAVPACRTPAPKPARAPAASDLAALDADATAPSPPAATKPRPKQRPPRKLKVTRRPAPPPPPAAATATPPKNAPLDLAFLGSKSACAMVLGGGTITQDEGVEVDLAQANGALATAVADRLADDGYAVLPLPVFTRESGDRSRVVASELAKRRCNKVVQISHFLKEPSYGFLVTMLAPVTDQFDPSQDLWRFHWEAMAYTRRYAFRWSEDAVFELDIDELAATVARELAESGLIARRTAGAAP